jgi:hypothetical protein
MGVTVAFGVHLLEEMSKLEEQYLEMRIKPHHQINAFAGYGSPL